MEKGFDRFFPLVLLVILLAASVLGGFIAADGAVLKGYASMVLVIGLVPALYMAFVMGVLGRDLCMDAGIAANKKKTGIILGIIGFALAMIGPVLTGVFGW